MIKIIQTDVIKILVIKNGQCNTDVKTIINQIDNEIVVDILQSSVDFNDIDITFYKGIIILGGHQTLTNRHDQNYSHKYLNNLINHVAKWIEQNVYILGICLGAQIIGEAIGYKTQKLGYVEFGYNKNIIIDHNKIANDGFLTNNVIDKLHYVLSYHSDYINVDINDELNNNIIGKIQSRNKQIPYIIKTKNTYGLQFHPDITIRILNELTELYPFDENVINYANNNKSKITETIFTVFRSWINLIIK